MIPVSRTKLAVSIDDLKRLPAGANYAIRSGQNYTTISYKTDSVIIESICDSLQTVVYEYEKEMTAMRQKTEYIEQEEKINVADRDRFSLKWYCVGIVSGILLIVVGILIFKIK